MKIHGLNKTTLLDYPGTLASVIFLGTCNFCCPWCHNKNLVLAPHLEPAIPEEEVLTFLKKRQGILEGVCITGGEPTLQQDLPAFIGKIKALGYKVKLDTNGYRPDMIRTLLDARLLDYIAMDIKADPLHYGQVCGLPDLNIHVIKTSADLIMKSGIAYEFRTTVIRELHDIEQFHNIGQWLAGCQAYYLQPFRDSEGVIQPGYSSYPAAELESFRHVLKETIPVVEIRTLS